MVRSFSFMCILAFLLLVSYDAAFAQTGPTGAGSRMLSGKSSLSSKGGDLYGGFGDEGNKRITSVSGSGSGGYFLLSHVALGAVGSLELESYEGYNEITLGIGPQAWIFIGGSRMEDTAAGSVYPFLTAAFLYTHTKTKMEVAWLDDSLFEQESSNSMNTIKFGGGLCYMVTDTVGFTLEANYEIDKIKFEGPESFEGSDKYVEGNKINVIAGISAFIY